MSRRRWTIQPHHRLERQLHDTPDARTYRRTLALLEYSRGQPIARIAETLGVTRQSVYNWLAAYAESLDPEALIEHPRSGRPRVWTDERKEVLRALMGTSPDRLGAAAVNWTVPLLQGFLEQATGERFSQNTIRRELRRQDYVWKRPRYVLEPDPEREKKTVDCSSRAAAGLGERGAGGG